MAEQPSEADVRAIAQEFSAFSMRCYETCIRLIKQDNFHLPIAFQTGAAPGSGFESDEPIHMMGNMDLDGFGSVFMPSLAAQADMVAWAYINWCLPGRFEKAPQEEVDKEVKRILSFPDPTDCPGVAMQLVVRVECAQKGLQLEQRYHPRIRDHDGSVLLQRDKCKPTIFGTPTWYNTAELGSVRMTLPADALKAPNASEA